jgi:hypothetical protein
MRQKREVKMEGETTKEDGEHGHPFEVLDEASPEALFSEAVAEDGKGDIAHGAEDDDETEEDLPGFHVEFIEVAVKPANEEVVHYCERESGGQSVVWFVSGNMAVVVRTLTGRYIADNRDLGRQLHTGKKESSEEWSERTLPQPCMNWVEDKFVATISISSKRKVSI